MKNEMNVRVALVTGANRGIGREVARRLGREGFVVAVTARDEAKARETARWLEDQGLRADPLVLDVTSPADIEAASRHLEATYGKLDVLVNNAGVHLDGTWIGNTTLATPAARLRTTFETNFFGVVALTTALLPLVGRSRAGRIVNVSSVMGSLALHADPSSPIYDHKPFAYDASKAALNAYTVHLAQALVATPVKVNSAHPGWVRTDLGGEGADLDVETGAETVVQLALLPADGPTGGFFHRGSALPW